MGSASATSPAEVSAPIPPPCRAAKRWSIAAILFLVTLSILWLLWAWIGHRRLQAQIDIVRARGEPFYPEEVVVPDVPPEKDAVPTIRAAIAAVVGGIDSPANSNLMYAEYPPYPSEWHTMADKAEAADAPALVLARKARAFPNAGWGTDLMSSLNTPFVSSLNSMRTLANVLGDSASNDHQHGDDAEAIEKLRDTLHLGTLLMDHTNSIGYLVGVGIHSLALQRLSVIAPELQIEGAIHSPPTTMPVVHRVSRETVAALIRELLDQDLPREQLQAALLAARISLHVELRTKRNKVTILRPMFDLDAARALDRENYIYQASLQPDGASANAVLAKQPTDVVGAAQQQPFGWPPVASHDLPRFSRIPHWDEPMWNRVLEMYRRYLAAREAAAISLAAELYRADTGQWPTNFNVLVPKYLPAIPNNPFLKDSRAGYVLMQHATPARTDRPLVYFDIGSGASSAVSSANPSYSWRGTPGREYWDLSLFVPPPPATVPADSESDPNAP